MTALGRATAFIDTGALLALSHRRDQHHDRAVEIARRHRTAGGTFVGTTLVLSEFYSHLLYLRGRDVARAALKHLLDDPIQDWLPVDPELVGAAHSAWLTRFEDQDLSLVDTVSFEVMRRHGVEVAFAFDHHFEIAGFGLLQ